MENIIDIQNNKLVFNDKSVYIVFDKDGNPWFKAKNICDILGYKKSRNAVKRHTDDEDKLIFKNLLYPGSGPYKFDRDLPNHTIFVNESGLYSLVLSSKLPEAKTFRRWVTSEVLPSIRKNNEYKIRNYYEVKIDKINKTLEDIKTQNDHLILQNKNFQEKYDNDISELKQNNKIIIKDLKFYYRSQRKELNDKLENQSLTIDKKQNRILELVSQLKDKIIKPSDEFKQPMLLILKDEDDIFKVVRGQKKRTELVIKNNIDHHDLFYYVYEPNPITFFDKTKTNLINEKKIKVLNKSELKLINDYSREDFLEDLELMGLERIFKKVF